MESTSTRERSSTQRRKLLKMKTTWACIFFDSTSSVHDVWLRLHLRFVVQNQHYTLNFLAGMCIICYFNCYCHVVEHVEWLRQRPEMQGSGVRFPLRGSSVKAVGKL